MEEELMYEADAKYGDPRVCPRHPHVVTSSPDGMFDANCGECEDEMMRAVDGPTEPLPEPIHDTDDESPF